MKKYGGGGKTRPANPGMYAIGGMLDKKISKMGGGMLAAMNIRKRKV